MQIRDFLCYICHGECKCLQSFHTFQTDIQDPCHWYDMSDYPPSATPYPSHLGGCLDQTETCFFSTCLKQNHLSGWDFRGVGSLSLG